MRVGEQVIKRKREEDQRVVANMNIEGMPWYRKHSNLPDSKELLFMNKKERKAAILGGMMTIMPVVFAYILMLSLMVLFLTYVWL